MSPRSVAAVLLLVFCLQVAVATPAGNNTLNALLKGKLVKGVLVKGAKHAMSSTIGAGAGFAAGAISGLPVTTFEAPWMLSEKNFTQGYSGGNAFCFPRYRAAVVEKPMFACADSYTLNHTKLGFACVKRSFSKMNNCFKTMECPDAGGYTQMNEICLPTEVRNVMVGILTVFKLKATLPFALLPSLKKAISKAVLAPIVLPKALLHSMVNTTDITSDGVGGEAVSFSHNGTAAAGLAVPETGSGVEDMNSTLIHPADLFKFAFGANVSHADHGLFKALAVNGSSGPLEIVTKGILNCNVSDIMSSVPELNKWIAAKLHGSGNVSHIGSAINATFPLCASRCCRQENHKDTALVLPTAVCSNGTAMNNLLGLCVGGEMGYSPCPGNFTRCPLPSGVPLCLAETTVWGMDSCKVAGILMHNLPKQQCPMNVTEAAYLQKRRR